jgi:hypothetical protein
LLFRFQEFGRDDDVFRWDNHYLAVFPTGNWISEAFVHQKCMVNRASQDLLDVIRMCTKVIFGQERLGLFVHRLVSEKPAHESGSITIGVPFLVPEATESGSMETELSYTDHDSANG